MADPKHYITAGLPAIDYDDSPPTGDNVFLITAGLVANDYTPATGGASKLLLLQNTLGGDANRMTA